MTRRAMSRAEWCAYAESTPATINQVGTVHNEFARVGFGADERASRLALSAALLGLDGLDSTKSLTLGQCGQLIHLLGGIRDRGELYAAAGLDDQADGGMSLAGAVLNTVKMFLAIEQARKQAAAQVPIGTRGTEAPGG